MSDAGTDRGSFALRFPRDGEKGVRHLLPGRPEGRSAQKVPDPFFFAAGLLLAAGTAYAQSVPRYGLFEATVTNTQSYANPFTGTSLTVIFTSPSLQQTTVDGFHDGGQTWRLRFMPDEIGQWTYAATFSDGAPGTSGSFQCTAGNLRGPLRVRASNPLWFEHADGTPFYLSSFHLWFVCRLDSRGVLLSTLDYLRGQGFNAVVGPHLADPQTLFPWVETGGTYDFSRFNVTEWQRMDKVLAEMGARGMVHIPFQWFGGTNNVPKIDTAANQDLFLRYWVARWRGYWNATYQPIAEWEEGYSQTEVLNILSRIRQLDNQKHLVSIHSQTVSSTTVQQSPNYLYHTVQDKLQDFNPTKYTSFVNLYNGANKPMLAHECLWEGNLYQQAASLDMDNMRRGAWTIALCGGQINYADEVLDGRNYQTPGHYSPNFSEMGTEREPLGWLYPYLTILSGTLRAQPFHQMTLQPGLASTGICLAQTGSRYLAYSPSGGTMTLNLTAAPGSLQSRWLNPRNGVLAAPVPVQGGAVRTFNAPDTTDWVLYVEQAALADSTPPAPVTGLIAAGGFLKNTLNWTGPSDADYTGAVIRYSTSGYPVNSNDGNPVADEPGTPAWPDAYIHSGLTRGVTYYYSVFAHDWSGNPAPAANASAIPLGLADYDFDLDVDQSDFAFFQRCLSGDGHPLTPGCEAADLDGEGDVDASDLLIFLQCHGGSNQVPGC